MPFYHAWLPVYSWMSCPVTTNMYQFDEHTMWIGTISCWDKKEYLLLSLFLTPLSAQGLALCSTNYVSFFPSHFESLNFLTYSAGPAEEMQNKNLGGVMPVIHLRWYLDKFVVDCENIDAAVVVDETPAMAAKIAMSDGRTKFAPLAVSGIRQKNVSSDVGGALQHTITVRYMLEDDGVENGVTGAHCHTQEHWLLGSLPLWV